MSETGTSGVGAAAPVPWGSAPPPGSPYVPPDWAPPPPGQRPLPGPDLRGWPAPAVVWSPAPAAPPPWYSSPVRPDPMADPWAPEPAPKPRPAGARRTAARLLLGVCALLLVTDGVAAAAQSGSSSPTAAGSAPTTVPVETGPSGTGTGFPAPTKSAPTTVPQPVTPADFQRFSVPAEHFSIAVPDGWHRQDPSSAQFQQQNSQFAAENGLHGGSPADYKFVADDLHQSVVSVEAVAVDGEGPAGLPDAVTSFEGGLRQSGATVLSDHKLQINGEPAEYVSYHFSGKADDGEPISLDLTSYLLVEGGYFYAIDEEGPNGQLPEIATTFASSVLGAQAPSFAQ